MRFPQSHIHSIRKALCMSGYNVDGTPLCVLPVIPPFICFSSLYNRAVTAVTGPSDLPRPKPPKQSDARRNLYVLGIPFDLTKCVHSTNYLGLCSRYPSRVEFTEIFSRFGTVFHAVILATVDNASRRRGFIVMSQHHEAKLAMDALNRKDIK